MAQAKPLSRPLAIVTGASSGIGYELARLCAQNGYDLVIAADRPLADAARDLRAAGANVETVETDLATLEGVDRLHAAGKDARSRRSSPMPVTGSGTASSTRILR